ncbi:MAG TPA: hypothetical protein VGN14_13180 [Candidatus Elarobacter sp.]
MAIGPPTGWIALAAIPVAAVLGATLRRVRGSPLLTRMRPHAALGLTALAVGCVHAMWSMRALAAADGRGVWLGSAALLAFVVQGFVGASLWDPGAYRGALRRWHAAVFWSLLLLALGHVVFAAPYFQGMTGAS